MKDLMYGPLFLYSSTSLWYFSPGTFFSNTGLDNLPWTSFILDPHTKLRIICKGVPGLATDIPCGVSGRGEPLASRLDMYIHNYKVYIVTIVANIITHVSGMDGLAHKDKTISPYTWSRILQRWLIWRLQVSYKCFMRQIPYHRLRQRYYSWK